MTKRLFMKFAALVVALIMTVSTLMTVAVGAAPAMSEEDPVQTLSKARNVADNEVVARTTTSTGINVNGRRVLEGRVLVIDNITYVPMFKFADWLGVFTYSSSANGSITTGIITGENLKIAATENGLYIIANGRYFYTVGKVKEINGELYVPVEPLVKALNCRTSKNAQGAYVVSSGDTRRLKNASQFYREDEVYWLSRIISAEARGESLQGKIAVGNVVLNRVRSSQFPNTIYGVIFDKKYGVQFAPTSNGTIYNTPTEESIIAAKICLEGYSISNKILYFFNPKYASGAWVKANREYAFSLGNHVFYN